MEKNIIIGTLGGIALKQFGMINKESNSQFIGAVIGLTLLSDMILKKREKNKIHGAVMTPTPDIRIIRAGVNVVNQSNVPMFSRRFF